MSMPGHDPSARAGALALALAALALFPLAAPAAGRGGTPLASVDGVRRHVHDPGDGVRRRREADAAVVHLRNRATLGATPEFVAQVRSLGVEEWR